MSANVDFRPKSDFLRTHHGARVSASGSDLAGLDEKALAGEVVAYIGFDCTAPSLHIGSLVQIMMLHWLQQTGRQAGAADGRRHDTRGRSLGQGRDRASC